MQLIVRKRPLAALALLAMTVSCRDVAGPVAAARVPVPGDSTSGGATPSGTTPWGTTPWGTTPGDTGARMALRTQLAYARDGEIWRVNADGSDPVRLTVGPDADPAWSPDGRRIAFLSRCAAGEGLDECVLVPSTDPNDPSRTRVGWPRGVHGWPAWSPDGMRIAFTSDWAAFDFVSDIYIATSGDAEIAQSTMSFGSSGMVSYFQPAWSPDGRRLAVVACQASSLTCDVSTLAVMGLDGSGYQVLTEAVGFVRPAWSPDGETIAFASAGAIQWIRADASERGVIVAEGASPAWRRLPAE